jgi:MoxR-like ATPase
VAQVDSDVADPAARPSWWRYWGDGVPAENAARVDLPAPPPWRAFHGGPVQAPPPNHDEETERKLGQVDAEPRRRATAEECDLVNAALMLRRPLLVTGNPGTGKSSIAFRIARELHLGRVLQWPVTSRTTLRSGLYEYDVIGRAQAAGRQGPAAKDDVSIGEFIRLGPLGTALLSYERPRVLLVDELDKSDVDLPNDLLHIFENGEFTIPELVRARHHQPEVAVYTDDLDRLATVRDGRIRCLAFPFVVITSNGERDFPPAFLRRCLRLDLQPPNAEELAAMVRAQLPALAEDQRSLIQDFLIRTANDSLARDQLLNAVFMTTSGAYGEDREAWQRLIGSIWHSLALER